MLPIAIHRVTTLDLTSARGRGRSPTSGAPKSRRISRSSSARNRKSGMGGFCWHAIRFSLATASAPVYFDADSQASWHGATGAFRTGACSTASEWARCAALTARSYWAKMGQHTANAGRIYFPSGTPDLDDLSGGAVDIAGSVAREVEGGTGLTPADYRAGPHWDCVVSGAAIAMIRMLNVRGERANSCAPGSRPISRARISPNFPRCIWCTMPAISPRRCRGS